MEQNPSGINFSAEKFSDDKNKKKKNKSKRFGFVAPVVETSEPKSETRKEQSNADKILAELAFSRDKQPKKPETAKETAKRKQEAETEAVDEILDAAEARKKLAEAFNTDYTQEIKASELPASKLFSEGIIDLGREDEQIVALHEEAKQKMPEAEPEVLWRAQPEQQHRAQVETSDEQEPSEVPAVAAEAEFEADTTETEPALHEAVQANAGSTRETEPPASVPSATRARHTSSGPSFTSVNQAPLPPNPNVQPSAPAPANVAPHTAPNMPPNPNLVGAFIPGAANYNQAPVPTTTNPNVVDKNKYVTKEEYDDGVYRATKYGQNRGVLAGLTVAGYEHFKHRRRERGLKKELQQQQKVANKTEKQHYFETAEQKKLLNEKERQLSEMQAAAARQSKTEAQPAATQSEHSAATMEKTTVAEHSRVTRAEKVENRFTAQLEKLVPKRPEKAKTAEAEPTEQLEIPPEHHLEASAWHTIEVDTKTGKAVETPTFAYGEEYYRERAKETRQRTDGQKQAAGEVAIVAAALSEDTSAGGGGQPAQATPPSASKQQRMSPRQILAMKAKDVLQTSKPVTAGHQSTGPLWPWLLAFAVVVVLLIVVL